MKSNKASRYFRPELVVLEDRVVPSGPGEGVNHAPIAVANTVATLEDTRYVFQVNDFGFSDPNDSPANNFLAVRIASLPSAGALTLNGEAVLVNDFVSVADINAGLLAFASDPDANGPAYASWDFQAQDDGGTSNGGVDLDATPRAMTLDVTAVNDAPSLAASDPPMVVEYGDSETIPAWATFNPGGGPDEADQTATFFITNVNNPELFEVLPAVAPDGTLTYTLASYMNGTSTFDLAVQDSGNAISGIQALRITAFRVLAPFTVNTAGDLPDALVGDGRARDANGNTSLRAAIMEGNAAAPAQNAVTILFNKNLAGSTINLGSALPNIVTNMSVSGLGANQLTIRRDANALFRIFTIAPNTTASVSNLSITNGKTPGGLEQTSSGGAIASQGTLIVAGVHIYGNEGGSSGGAIANLGGTLTVDGCSIYSNQAANFGGGLYNRGTATIRSATMISGNSGSSGGGIYNADVGQLTVETGSWIFLNCATGTGFLDGRGGGIASFGTLSMTDAVLYQNNSVREGGGLFSNGTSTLTSVLVQENRATGVVAGKGGGIYVRRGTTTLVSGCSVFDNWAQVDTQIQEDGWGISWADGAVLIANRPQNNIVDSIAYDPSPQG